MARSMPTKLFSLLLVTCSATQHTHSGPKINKPVTGHFTAPIAVENACELCK